MMIRDKKTVPPASKVFQCSKTLKNSATVQENKELVKDQYRTRSGCLVKPPEKLTYT